MEYGILELELEQEVTRAGDLVLIRFGSVGRVNAQKAAQRPRHYHIGLKYDF